VVILAVAGEHVEGVELRRRIALAGVKAGEVTDTVGIKRAASRSRSNHT
jgi:hypothetical protein